MAATNCNIMPEPTTDGDGFVDASADAMCPICDMVVSEDPTSIGCDSCSMWYHLECSGLKKHQQKAICALSDCVQWFCSKCGLPSKPAAIRAPTCDSESSPVVSSGSLEATIRTLTKKVELIHKEVSSLKMSSNRAARAMETARPSIRGPVPLISSTSRMDPPPPARTTQSSNSTVSSASAQELAFRRNNLIIAGIPEPDHSLEVHDRVQADRAFVLDICYALNVPPDPNAQLHRLGAVSTTGVPRVTRVEFKDPSVRGALLNAKSKLKGSTHSKVYIHPDRSKNEQIAHKQRLAHLAERRRNGEQVSLLGRKFVTRSSSADSTVPTAPQSTSVVANGPPVQRPQLITNVSLSSALGNLLTPTPVLIPTGAVDRR